MTIYHKIATGNDSPPVLGKSKMDLLQFYGEEEIPDTPIDIVEGLREQGYTQSEIAQYLGVSKFTVQSWTRTRGLGKRNPTVQHLRELENLWVSKVGSGIDPMYLRLEASVKLHRSIKCTIDQDGYHWEPEFFDGQEDMDRLLQEHLERFENSFEDYIGEPQQIFIGRSKAERNEWEIWFNGTVYFGDYEKGSWLKRSGKKPKSNRVR